MDGYKKHFQQKINSTANSVDASSVMSREHITEDEGTRDMISRLASNKQIRVIKLREGNISTSFPSSVVKRDPAARCSLTHHRQRLPSPDSTAARRPVPRAWMAAAATRDSSPPPPPWTPRQAQNGAVLFASPPGAVKSKRRPSQGFQRKASMSRMLASVLRLQANAAALRTPGSKVNLCKPLVPAAGAPPAARPRLPECSIGRKSFASQVEEKLQGVSESVESPSVHVPDFSHVMPKTDNSMSFNWENNDFIKVTPAKLREVTNNAGYRFQPTDKTENKTYFKENGDITDRKEAWSKAWAQSHARARAARAGHWEKMWKGNSLTKLKTETHTQDKTKDIAKNLTKIKSAVKIRAEEKAKARLRAKLTAKAEAEARAKIEANALAEARAKAEAELQAKKAEIEAKAKAEAIASLLAKTRAELAVKVLSEVQAKAKAEAKAEAESVARARTLAMEKTKAMIKAKAELRSKAEMRLKARGEAKVSPKANAHAKAKVSRPQTEPKQKSKAEAEARAVVATMAKSDVTRRVIANVLDKAVDEAFDRLISRARVEAENRMNEIRQEEKSLKGKVESNNNLMKKTEGEIQQEDQQRIIEADETKPIPESRVQIMDPISRYQPVMKVEPLPEENDKSDEARTKIDTKAKETDYEETSGETEREVNTKSYEMVKAEMIPRDEFEEEEDEIITIAEKSTTLTKEASTSTEEEALALAIVAVEMNTKAVAKALSMANEEAEALAKAKAKREELSKAIQEAMSNMDTRINERKTGITQAREMDQLSEESNTFVTEIDKCDKMNAHDKGKLNWKAKTCKKLKRKLDTLRKRDLHSEHLVALKRFRAQVATKLLTDACAKVKNNTECRADTLVKVRQEVVTTVKAYLKAKAEADRLKNKATKKYKAKAITKAEIAAKTHTIPEVSQRKLGAEENEETKLFDGCAESFIDAASRVRVNKEHETAGNVQSNGLESPALTNNIAVSQKSEIENKMFPEITMENTQVESEEMLIKKSKLESIGTLFPVYTFHDTRQAETKSEEKGKVKKTVMISKETKKIPQAKKESEEIFRVAANYYESLDKLNAEVEKEIQFKDEIKSKNYKDVKEKWNEANIYKEIAVRNTQETDLMSLAIINDSAKYEKEDRKNKNIWARREIHTDLESEEKMKKEKEAESNAKKAYVKEREIARTEKEAGSEKVAINSDPEDETKTVIEIRERKEDRIKEEILDCINLEERDTAKSMAAEVEEEAKESDEKMKAKLNKIIEVQSNNISEADAKVKTNSEDHAQEKVEANPDEYVSVTIKEKAEIKARSKAKVEVVPKTKVEGEGKVQAEIDATINQAKVRLDALARQRAEVAARALALLQTKAKADAWAKAGAVARAREEAMILEKAALKSRAKPRFSKPEMEPKSKPRTETEVIFTKDTTAKRKTKTWKEDVREWDVPAKGKKSKGSKEKSCEEEAPPKGKKVTVSKEEGDTSTKGRRNSLPRGRRSASASGPRVAVALSDGLQEWPLDVDQWHISKEGKLVLDCSIADDDRMIKEKTRSENDAPNSSSVISLYEPRVIITPKSSSADMARNSRSVLAVRSSSNTLDPILEGAPWSRPQRQRRSRPHTRSASSPTICMASFKPPATPGTIPESTAAAWLASDRPLSLKVEAEGVAAGAAAGQLQPLHLLAMVLPEKRNPQGSESLSRLPRAQAETCIGGAKGLSSVKTDLRVTKSTKNLHYRFEQSPWK